MSIEPQSQGDGDPGPSRSQQLAQVIAEALDLDVAEVLPGCRLVDDYGMSRSERDNLVWALEEWSGLTIPTHAADKWQSVADIIEYLDQRGA